MGWLWAALQSKHITASYIPPTHRRTSEFLWHQKVPHWSAKLQCFKRPLNLAVHPHKTSTHMDFKLLYTTQSGSYTVRKKRKHVREKSITVSRTYTDFMYVYVVCSTQRTALSRQRSPLAPPVPSDKPRAQLPLRMSTQAWRCWDGGLVDVLFSLTSLEGSRSSGNMSH